LQNHEKHSTLIQMFHVHKRYENRYALNDVTLDIADGEFLFLSGPSGAGKTTLLKLLYMGEKASRGQIIVDGLNLSRIPRRKSHLFRRKFGIIFQDYKLIPTRTVFDNIALVAEAVGTRRNLIQKRVGSLLRMVDMEKHARQYPLSLSGGEQQRVAVARAIAGNPKIIVADEPTGNLDSESAHIVLDLLKQYHRIGATVIVATHDTDLIHDYGGRVVLLKDGQIETSTVLPKKIQ